MAKKTINLPSISRVVAGAGFSGLVSGTGMDALSSALGCRSGSSALDRLATARAELKRLLPIQAARAEAMSARAHLCQAVENYLITLRGTRPSTFAGEVKVPAGATVEAVALSQ